MKAHKPEMILAPRSALKADIIELSAVKGKLSVERKDVTMHGRWYFLTLLSDILTRPVLAEDVRVVSIECGASLIRAKHESGAKARAQAAKLVVTTLKEEDTCLILFRQDTWKVIQVKGWRGAVMADPSDVTAGMRLLGQPGSGKALEVLSGAVSARISGFLGNCLLQMHGDAAAGVRIHMLSKAGQEAVSRADCPDTDFSNYGMGPDLKPVHDGSVQVNGNFVMTWAYGPDWKTLGVRPFAAGTVLKTVRLALNGIGIVKGNGFVRWDMPDNVDMYVHEENLKKDWIPYFNGLVVHSIVNHETQLRTDRQWLTMFHKAAKAVFGDYLSQFFVAFEAAVAGGNEAIQDFIGGAIEASEDDFFENEEHADARACARILRKFNLGQFPQLTSQIINAATGGGRMSQKVALGAVPISKELATRAYILPELTGFGADGYYYPSRTSLRASEAVCGSRTGVHAIFRSPHANPWEVRTLNLVQALNGRPAIGTVWVSWMCIADVLKTLGGADLDDSVGLNKDPRVVEAIQANLVRPEIDHDKELVAKFGRRKAEACSPTWAQIINFNLDALRNGTLAVVGAWASTVCRYLLVYEWMDSKGIKLTPTLDEFVLQVKDLKLDGVFTPLMGVPKHTGDKFFKRYGCVRVGQVVFHEPCGKEMVSLPWLLYRLLKVRKQYNVLLQPWFGEEYIDAANKGPNGDHEIVALFNYICTLLDEVGLGEVYGFAGSGIKKAPFLISSLFMGTFNLVRTGLYSTGQYFLDGERDYVNGVMSDVFRLVADSRTGEARNSKVHSAAFKRTGGVLDPISALLPAIELGKHKGKKVAYRLWADTPDEEVIITKRWVSSFYKNLWRPYLAVWQNAGTAGQMAAAMYKVVRKHYRVQPTSQYKWDLEWDCGLYGFFQSLPEADRTSWLARVLGAINVTNIKKTSLTAKLRSMAHSETLPDVVLPADRQPSKAQIATAAAILYTYMGMSLADSVWQFRGTQTRLNGADILVKYQQADSSKLDSTLSAVIDQFASDLELPENVVKAIRIIAMNHIVNDRLLWEDQVGVRVAYMLEQFGVGGNTPTTPTEDQPVTLSQSEEDFIEASYDLEDDYAALAASHPSFSMEEM